VFSYANGRISQIGLVETAAVTAPKPPEFGTAGDNWSQEGWLVRVNWQPLGQPLVPQTFFELLQPLLPERHSPISTITGRGNQGVYLAGLSETLGLLLLKLIEDHADPTVRLHLVVLAEEGAYIAALFDSERLSGANGLLLSPHVDKLFDRHWISFDAGGELICEHEAAREALRCWGVDGANLIRPFSRDQERFLEAHREALRR
jgi:hypothetical protein